MVVSEVLWSDFLDLNPAPLLTGCDLEHPCFCLLTWTLRVRVVDLLLCCLPLHLAHLTTGQQSTVSEKAAGNKAERNLSRRRPGRSE